MIRPVAKSTVEMYIANIVAIVDYRIKIDKMYIASKLHNVEESSFGIRIQLRKPLISYIKIFDNGKALFMGCRRFVCITMFRYDH